MKYILEVSWCRAQTECMCHWIESRAWSSQRCYKYGVFWDVTPCGSCKNDIPEDTILYSHRRENLKSYNVATDLPVP
jgi:hypothetical protein